MDYLLPWLRLQFTPGLGRVGLMRLIAHFKTPENALAAAAKGWPKLPGLRKELASMVPAANAPRIQKACQGLVKMDGWLRTIWDPDYPQILRHIPDPPVLLYGCGTLPDELAIAIVGTRNPTDFGRRFTEQLAEELAVAGVIVISGLARGIDAAAHRGALRGGGKTLAVLGCGIDRIYPRDNTRLYHQIIEQGTIISEYPPGSEPLPGHFPGRNRIISGLSKGTLVMEACRKSGSLITAEFALEQGKEVMAVPGGVNNKTSYGPNLLIKQGAHAVTESIEILEIIGAGKGVRRTVPQTEPAALHLTEPAGSVLSKLDLTPRHSDELADESGLTVMELSAILLHLELQGYAEKLPGGRYIRGRLAH
ncbi:MAG: DNA-processing protein DprA [Desulfuromonadales bacterium]|nr:DNA-processing protein DprA [Desulfuromonadales bacterium]